MPQPSHDNLRIAEEAALWLLRLQREDTPAVRAEFSAWIRKGATHLQEFLFAQAIWREFDDIDPAVVARLDRSADSGDIVIDLPVARSATAQSPVSTGRGSRTLRWGMGLAAGVAALLMTWIALTIYPIGTRTYATNLGDQQAIKLEDGSVILLNTNSKVAVHYSRNQRNIRLLEGEALFTVEKDAARPFIVTTDSARVRAIGTQFNVNHSRSSTTRVAVLNGIVQVTQAATLRPDQDISSGDMEPVRLVAGDEAQVDALGRIARSPRPNPQRAIAWRERRLIFPGNSVADIAEEFNRYNRIPIRVLGDTIRQRRMSGVFDADDPSPLIRFLAKDPQLEIVTGASEIVVRPRHPLPSDHPTLP